MEFGDWLQTELRERNLSLTAFAGDVRVSPGTVSRWINGLRRPEHELCERIAWVLDYDPAFVLVQAGHEPYPKAREEQLRLELERAQNRAFTVNTELEKLARERDELTQRIEQLYIELDRLESSRHPDPQEEALRAIDQLRLSETIKDRLRRELLDSLEEEQRSPDAVADAE